MGCGGGGAPFIKLETNLGRVVGVVKDSKGGYGRGFVHVVVFRVAVA